MWWSRQGELRRRRQAQALTRAIAELPLATRRAMLEAADSEQLIVGAYTDRSGRMCPMLAAHRRGARTHARGFPSAWDSFARASRPRLATERELQILKALLQESLSGSSSQIRLGQASPAAEPEQTPTP